MNNLLYCLAAFVTLISCDNNKVKPAATKNAVTSTPIIHSNTVNLKVIHVFVALCDNKYQGIVPVPAGIGNGQDAATNLYWGCAFGVKGFFTRQKNWQLLADKKFNTGSLILERLVFKYQAKDVYFVADAYDGKEIKNCTINFLKSCAGNFADSVIVNNRTVYCGGASQVLAYIGHDGLMDFSLTGTYTAIDNKKREAMIFACISKKYFASHIKNTGAIPVVWTSGLCSPEAYSLSAALESRINNEAIENAAFRSAEAYHKYQKCGIKAAKRLMVYN
jgi:hypothetical protein